MKKSFFLVPLLGITILLFAGCNKQTIGEVCSLTGNTCGTASGTAELSGMIDAVMLAIKNTDLPALSQFVGPQGLRFSPYEYVNTGTDIVLSSGQVYNGLALSRSFTWGSYDGSGNPIDLGIGQYFEKFVQDADYMHATQISYNTITQRGNTINNIAQVYSGKQWVEFYFSGFDAQYEGMDRKSLTLVFDNINNTRYLIGIVHGQRTI